MMNKKNNSRAGFTLIEIMIAIVLFSIMVAIGVGGLTVAIRSQRQAAALLGAQSNVSLAVEQMAREVRTGYLFCHLPGDYQDIDTTCEPCTITASSYKDPAAHGAIQTGPDKGYLPVWTCSALDFYNSDTDHVIYSLQNGMLMRQDNNEDGGAAEAITNSNVTVKYFNVVLFGNTEGDNWNPRITVSLGITPSSSDPAIQDSVLNLQTTISARTIDCTLGSPPNC